MSRTTLPLVALVVLLSLAGCSSDSKDGSATAKKRHAPVTTTTVKRPAKDAADLTAYCATWREIMAAGTPDLTGAPAAIADKIKAHYGKVAPLGVRLEQEAPAEIKPVVKVTNGLIREALDTGSADPFRRPESATNGQTLKAFSDAHCAEKG